MFSGNLIIVSMNKKKCILNYGIFPCVCHTNIWTAPSVFLWPQICMFIGFYLEISVIWTQIWHQSLHPKFWLQPMYTLCYISSSSCKSEGQEHVCSLLQTRIYSRWAIWTVYRSVIQSYLLWSLNFSAIFVRMGKSSVNSSTSVFPSAKQW